MRHLILAGIVVTLVAIQTANGQWSSDMWIHVAVVRTLSLDPIDTTNAVLVPYASPYTVGLGLLASFTGWSSVTVLSVAAIANVVLFVLALRAFVVELTDNVRATFWALLFVLLLWGPSPYRFSGFFSANSIGFVAPFPATFATSLALLAIAASHRYLRGGPAWLSPTVGGLVAVVVVTHPITGTWCVLAIVVVAVCRSPRNSARAGLVVGASLLGCAATLLWPWWTALDLLSASGAYEQGNEQMYERVLLRIAPVLLGVAALGWRLGRDRLDPLGWMFLCGCGLYAIGTFGGAPTWGRALALVVLVAQVGAADAVARLEAGRSLRTDRRLQLAGGLLAMLLLVGAVSARGGLSRMVPTWALPGSIRSNEALARPDETFAFLADHLDATDVVASNDPWANLMVAAFAAQTLDPPWRVPLLDHEPQARRDNSTLLAVDTSTEQRWAIIKDRGVTHALIRTDSQIAGDLTAMGGAAVAEGEGFVLLRLHRPAR